MNQLFIIVRNYLRAAAYLYGMISLKELYGIFSLYNPRIPTDVFFDTVCEVYSPVEPYFLIGDDDIYDQSVWVHLEDRLVVHRQYCYATWDALFTLEQMQEGKSIRIFPEEEFLRYADPDYVPDLPQIQALSDMIGAHLRGPIPQKQVLAEAVWCARDDVTANQLLMEMQRLGCCFGNLQDRRNAVQIYQAVYNVVPKAIHSGNSEQELKTLPIPEAQKRQRYYLWFCPPKEDAHFDATPEELLKDAPYTGQTKRAGFLDRCMADSTLPQRLYDLCQCGSELYYCDCCGKR